MHVAQSMDVHKNQSDEVFYRVGDKSKKLNFEQRMQLVYAKGEHYYEDAPVNNATLNDLDLNLVDDYCKVKEYGKGAECFLRENGFLSQKENFNGDMVEIPNGAAVLLFGKNPQLFFQRARVRVIRYEGTEERVGRAMNVIKDKIFTGAILELTNKVIDFIGTQIKEHTFLGPNGLFVTVPQYPEFCWKELVINSICHRDYSILGTDIQVKIFDNHFTVESPGLLPGLVRVSNMREIHFSRNPKIAEYMHTYKFVKEFGEGIDRMYRELLEAGNPDPVFKQAEFMVKGTIMQPISTSVASSAVDDQKRENGQKRPEKWPEKWPEKKKIIAEMIMENNFVTISAIEKSSGIGHTTIKKYLKELQQEEIVRRVGPDRGGYWEIKVPKT